MAQNSNQNTEAEQPALVLLSPEQPQEDERKIETKRAKTTIINI